MDKTRCQTAWSGGNAVSRKFLSISLFLLAAGCAPNSATPPPVAEKPKVEAELARTTLPLVSVKSLGIVTQEITNRKVQEQVPLTGWVMVRQGNEVTMTAPVAGYVREAPGQQPAAGQTVRAGQDLFFIDPVLSPLEQIQLAALKRGIENELAKARESLVAAEAELNRVVDLHRQGLRGTQDVEQARVRHRHAREDIAAAEDKQKLFLAPGGDRPAKLAPVAIAAPRAGTVLSVPVSPGQYVPAAAPLITVADLGQLWVRVPVPEHFLPDLDVKRHVRIAVKSSNSNSSARPGKSPAAPATIFPAAPLALVPQVDPVRHTADMIYELPPGQRLILAKDQMLTVYLPLGREREETVVPYSAIVCDAYAGCWIYIDQTGKDAKEHVYERRRVELGPSVDGNVVVRPRCRPGERVVVAGAAALFSREFHVPPVRLGTKQEADDD
jgi:RND family efflux transporter MFP subunit